MSLKEQLKTKSASLVRRETLTLPETGLEVQVRGMMFGEKERVAEHAGFKQSAMMIALTVEDPSTGKPIWNANAAEDQQEIAGLPIADTVAIVEAIGRLSGFSGQGKGSPGTESSPSPSDEPSDEPSLSSTKA